MGIIENPKTYTGRDLETIFFRPMFAGESAEQLGIHTLYNMPVPTTVQMWSPRADILKEYSSGWDGGDSALRKQKRIELYKVKAEVGFSASDYFQQVYELITGRADVNLDDLTGSELEQAETEMFRAAIAESLRVLMWAGNTRGEEYTLFNGFITLAEAYLCPMVSFTESTLSSDGAVALFDKMWDAASDTLKSLKGDGNLVYYVTSNIYDAYERHLDQMGSDAAYTDMVTGRRELSYHGIKIVDMRISHILSNKAHICLLTDKRNLALAVNTSDYPGSEVRMWYNPDEMENRQRATFMAGCEILDESLVVYTRF